MHTDEMPREQPQPQVHFGNELDDSRIIEVQSLDLRTAIKRAMNADISTEHETLRAEDDGMVGV
jgi:hypothetical protein